MTADHEALRLALRGDAALCTIVGIDGSFSRRVGAQLAIAADGTSAGDLADNCLHQELAAQAAKARAEGAAKVMRFGRGSPLVDFRLPCGSGLDILIDPSPDRDGLSACAEALDRREAAQLALPANPLLSRRSYVPGPRLVLFGAGREAKALAELARAQGVEVTVRRPGAELALSQVPDDLTVDPWTATVLLFHDHEWEHALLGWALRTPAFLIGAQGGAPAREARLVRLRGEGFDEGTLARVRSPIGLIGRARDPAVLALSVLAELVADYEALHPHG